MAYPNALRVETRWSFKDGHVIDKQQTKEVAESNHLQRSNDVKVVKRLFTPETLSPLRAIRNEANQFLRLHTHPLDDKGGRLLPAALFAKFQAHSLKTQEKLDEAKAVLARNYEDIIAEAATRLNGMFRREDYPSVEDLLDSYALRVVYTPISDASDIRMGNLDEQARSELEAHVEAHVTEQIAEAHRNNYERLLDSISLLASRLEVSMVNPTLGTDEFDPDADLVAAKSIFRDSTVEAVVDMLDVAEEMNFSNDQGFNAMVQRIRDSLVDVDMSPQALRKDIPNREKAKAQLESAVADITANLPL